VDPHLKYWIGLWDHLDKNFWGLCNWTVRHLGPEDVSWQPAPAIASIGWNLEHLAEMLDYYLAHVFGRGKPVQTSPLLTMRSGSRDEGRYRDLEPIGAYHRQVRPLYRAFLTSLHGSDLDRPLGNSCRPQATYGWAIGHIAEHESYHLGKCMLLRTLLAFPASQVTFDCHPDLQFWQLFTVVSPRHVSAVGRSVSELRLLPLPLMSSKRSGCECPAHDQENQQENATYHHR
jgi:hypothetical protein